MRLRMGMLALVVGLMSSCALCAQQSLASQSSASQPSAIPTPQVFADEVAAQFNTDEELRRHSFTVRTAFESEGQIGKHAWREKSEWEQVEVDGKYYAREARVNGKKMADADREKLNDQVARAVPVFVKNRDHRVATTAFLPEKLGELYAVDATEHRTVEGHSYVVLKVMPRPETPDPVMMQRLELLVDPETLHVMRYEKERLAGIKASAPGSKSVITYMLVEGIPVRQESDERNFLAPPDGLKGHVFTHATYSNYVRLRVKVTIEKPEE